MLFCQACFSPGGSLVLTAGQDATARVWRWEEEIQNPQILSGHSDEVFSAIFAPFDRIITASKDNTCRVWQADT
jgi:WD40 repeat protein